jgi:hypothetical protein
MPRVDTLLRLVTATGARLKVEVEWDAPRTIDTDRNGRILRSVLSLVDHVPRVRRSDLTKRTLAREAR